MFLIERTLNRYLIFKNQVTRLKRCLNLIPILKRSIEYFGKYEIERYKNSGLTTIRVRKQGEYNYLMDLSDHLEYLIRY